MLLTLTMLVSLGFNTFSLVRERRSLIAIRDNQQVTIQQAERVRAQLDSIARRTLELAQQGNSGAAIIVEQLARRGLTIDPGPGPQAAPPDAQRPAAK
jgi:hypothetical protein